MTFLESCRLYTGEVASFRLGPEPESPPGSMGRDEARAKAGNLVGLAEKRGAEYMVLLGLGGGVLAGEVAEGLPEGMGMVVSELDPGVFRLAGRAGNLEWIRPGGRGQVLADASAWAHVCLWGQGGVDKDRDMFAVNPELPAEARSEYISMRRAFFQAGKMDAPPRMRERPDLTVASILSPEEPGLAEFFAHVPDWVSGLVAVWDGTEPPRVDFGRDVLHLARPLDDFAAQRNAMLDACRGEWVLYLDADERLDAETWDMAADLALSGAAEAFYLPRRTLFPDEDHFKVGYGLWPDLQLRLFRRADGLGFVRPVHERLHGVRGPVGVVLGRGIRHLSRIMKRPEGIERKLARFDKASRGRVTHHLSKEYPCVELSVIPEETSLLIFDSDPGRA